MSQSPYGPGFDGSNWPFVLDGSVIDGWWALKDSRHRYVSDACVEGDAEQWSGAAKALRERRPFYAKRLGVAFEDGEIHLWSPRNSVGGIARVPDRLADELAAVIETGLALGGPLTAETITDEQIRELLTEQASTTPVGPHWSTCVDAISDEWHEDDGPQARAHNRGRAEARARVARILNARTHPERAEGRGR